MKALDSLFYCMVWQTNIVDKLKLNMHSHATRDRKKPLTPQDIYITFRTHYHAAYFYFIYV